MSTKNGLPAGHPKSCYIKPSFLQQKVDKPSKEFDNNFMKHKADWRPMEAVELL